MQTLFPKAGRKIPLRLPVSLALFMTTFVLLCAQNARAVTVYVSTSGSNANSGSDWSQAKQSVQSGINAAVAGDQVWVAQGTYTELVTLKKSVAIYGGFIGNETDLSQRNFRTNVTILDGNQLGTVVTSPSDATIGPDTLIDGFTICNGFAVNGGGFASSAGSLTVSNNIFTGNKATNNGGGIICLNDSPTITGNTLKGNTAPNGGGIYFNTSGTITSNKIVGNLGLTGAGVYINGGSASIKNNIIYGNSASTNGTGGGIALNSTLSVTLANNLLDSNYAAYGAGLYLSQGSVLIANNTIVNNRTSNSYSGGGAYIFSSAVNKTLVSNLIAYNSSGIVQYAGVMAELSHNNVYSNYWTPFTAPQNYGGISAGATDLSVNSQFVDLSAANYRLLVGSPLIDAGDDSYSGVSLADLDGNSRLNGSHIDIGAYEAGTPSTSVTLSSLSPTSAIMVQPGASDQTLTLNGAGFVSGAVATWNGVPLTTTFISYNQLTAQIPASFLTAIDLAAVAIVSPDNSTTNTLFFQVVNPSPTVSNISPASGLTGDPAFTITINGSGFTTASLIRWTTPFYADDLTTTYVSPTQLTASVSASMIANAISVAVTVINQIPGGGTSNSISYQLSNPAPAISSLNPNSAFTGSPDLTLTVSGTGFIRSSVINWNGQVLTTTFKSSTQLTTVLAASILSTAGSNTITITTPTPGGGVSNGATFTVNQSQVPVLTSLSPASVTVGSPAVTVTANGSRFLPTSVITLTGTYPPTQLSTTYVSPTQLTGIIPASLLTAMATYSIGVSNPGPGGGSSASLPFYVALPTPTITSITPASAFVGGAGFTLTVNGTGFVTISQRQISSTVVWNSQRLTTTYVSPTILTATVPASNIASAGTASITVNNTPQGGGTSNAATFTIASANLALSSSNVYNTNTVTGTLTLAAPAAANTAPFTGGATGVYAPITSSSTAATFQTGANLVVGPDATKYVYIAPGQTLGTFTIATSVVTTATAATITAVNSGLPTSANLTINATQVSSLTIAPASLSPGVIATATLTLNGPAVAGALPQGQPRPGTYVPLTASSYFTILPGTTIVRGTTGQYYAYFPVGQTSLTFRVGAMSPPSTFQASVTGTLNGSTAVGTATIIIP